MTRRRSSAIGIDANAMLDLALYMIIAGILFGRIGYVLLNLGQFTGDPWDVLRIWRDGGLTFYGALLGGIWGAWLYTRGRRLSTAALLDLTSSGRAPGDGGG